MLLKENLKETSKVEEIFILKERKYRTVYLPYIKVNNIIHISLSIKPKQNTQIKSIHFLSLIIILIILHSITDKYYLTISLLKGQTLWCLKKQYY